MHVLFAYKQTCIKTMLYESKRAKTTRVMMIHFNSTLYAFKHSDPAQKTGLERGHRYK